MLNTDCFITVEELKDTIDMVRFLIGIGTYIASCDRSTSFWKSINIKELLAMRAASFVISRN